MGQYSQFDTQNSQKIEKLSKSIQALEWDIQFIKNDRLGILKGGQLSRLKAELNNLIKRDGGQKNGT